MTVCLSDCEAEGFFSKMVFVLLISDGDAEVDSAFRVLMTDWIALG